jgi:hypothetical protein
MPQQKTPKPRHWTAYNACFMISFRIVLDAAYDMILEPYQPAN